MGSGDDSSESSAPRRRRFWWTHQVAAANMTHLDVFFGSRTGTAKELVSDLATKASKRGVVVLLKEMNEFDPTHIDDDEQDSYYSPSRATVFVVSTHYAGPAPNAETFVQWLRGATDSTKGPTADPIVASPDGDSTTPMTAVMPGGGLATRSNRISPMSSPTAATSSHLSFSQSSPTAAASSRSNLPHSSHSGFNLNWRHLFRNKRKKSFARLQYAVFGVGNSTYLTYNAMGKLIDARLHALGATRLCSLGLGDVSNDISATFAKWEAQLLQQLAQYSTELGDSVPHLASSAKKVAPRPLISAGSAAQLTTPRRFSVSSVPAGPTLATRFQGRHQQRRGSILRRSSSATARSSGRQGASMREYFEDQPVAPLTLTVLDLDGRPVRLRFRCRFLANKRSEEARNASFLPEIVSHTGVGGRQSGECAPQSWFRLKTLSIFPHSGVEDFKRLALLRLSIEDSTVTFETANSFGFFPPNAPEVVDSIARLLGFDLDAHIEILVQSKDPDASMTALVQQAGEALPFPRICTVRTLLRNFLELRTVSREFVRLASGFVTVPKEHELLETLSSTDGAAAFRRHFTLEKGGVLKLLELAPSLRIPFEVLINITPLIKPRFHLIATSPLQSAGEFDIVVPVGDYDDADGLVAANWQYLFTRPISHEHLKDTNVFTPATPLLRGFFSESAFSTPSDRSAPMLLIAEGVGIVPFRALLMQRQLKNEADRFSSFSTILSRKSSHHHTQTKNLVLLGCSNQDSLLFESELLDLKKRGVIELRVAFHDDADKPHELVQNLVDQQWQQINSLMASSPTPACTSAALRPW